MHLFLGSDMNTARMWLIGVSFLVTLTGCRPQEVPQYSYSEGFTALVDLAEDDEDRAHWESLQEQIKQELAKNAGTPRAPVAFGDPEADNAQLALGAEVYEYRCKQCHGVTGNGLGAVAEYLDPKPRDYTKGIFKFTSTPYGAKPRRSDLLQTLRRGVPGTSMPSFKDLSPEELEAVVDYVILLSQRGELEQELVSIAEEEGELDPEYIQDSVNLVRDRWAEAQSQLVMPETRMPPMTAETIQMGQELYLAQVCNKCHGIDGRGGLAGNIEIGRDSWGHETAAADLTSGMYRGGGRPIDIYRRIHSGINGTPMPSFGQVFADDPDKIWYLVHFIRDTGERRRRNLPPAADASSSPTTTPPADQPTDAPAAEEPTAESPSTQGTAFEVISRVDAS
mgnify:CR=1 FL=1